MHNTIQARYDELERIGKDFGEAAEATEALRQRVRAAYAPLAEGGWIGRGASAFQAEMDSEIFPAIERMIQALREAQGVVLEIDAVLRRAEDEASAPFRGQASATPPTESATTSEPGFWDQWGEWVHGTLDVLGLVPIVGEAADGINGLIYLGEGRYVEAGISFAAMIPVVGDAGKAAKWTVKGGKMAMEGVADLGTRRALREGGEVVGERALRETDEFLRFGELAPSTRYTRNGYEYTTNEAGQVSRVTGELELDSAPRHVHQTEVGHMGIPGDEGGHLIASRFGGTSEGVNLVPQNMNLNRGAWKKMENHWAEQLEQGRRVQVEILVNYPSSSGVRPNRFEVLEWVDGQPSKRYQFKNQAGG